jgi:SAM-dependent methyltransferase
VPAVLDAAGARDGSRSALEALPRCAECAAELVVEGDEVLCRTAEHRFPIVDGVLVMVDDSALESDPQYGRQRQYFDAEFSGYARYQLENWRLSYLKRLRSAGLLSSDGPLIDVGVGGSGYTVIEAARSGSLAVGCDLSLEALVTARRFAVAEGVVDRTLWVCCSAENLPFASASFTSGLAIAVIEHVPDDLAALSELARVLQPNGRAWVTVPHGLRNISPVFRLPNRRHDKRLGHLRRYEAEGLVETGGSVCLNPVEVQFTGHPIKVLQLVARALGHRFWWWCEERDLRRSHVRRGSMQLSVLFERAG